MSFFFSKAVNARNLVFVNFTVATRYRNKYAILYKVSANFENRSAVTLFNLVHFYTSLRQFNLFNFPQS